MPVGEALYHSASTTVLIVGVVLWIRALVHGRVQPWLDAPARLPAWPIGWADFLLLPFIVLLLLMFLPYGFARLVGVEPGGAITAAAVMAGGFGFGAAFIGGTLVFRLHPAGRPGEGSTPLLRSAGNGALALVYFLPACTALLLLWTWLLDTAGVPHEVQDLVFVIRDASTPATIPLWLLLVVVMAPVGEELVFRGGIFRFLANRMRPGAAAAISAALFAAVHWNLHSSLPLFALGLALAAVYQRTGRLLAPIVLHAAFNLNTLLGIWSGAIE